MRLAIISATFGGVLAVVACSSSTDGPAPAGDAGPDAADAADAADASDGAAPLPYPLDQICAPATDPSLEACGKCARESCCDTRVRLLGTDAGAELADCLKQEPCGETCRSTCFDRAPSQTAPYLEHLTCLQHRCGEECGAPRDKCANCQEANCLREGLACDLSRDCLIYGSCFSACKGIDTCIADCDKRYPAAPPLLSAIVVCTANLCARDCQ